jgi:hypothetical protein
MKRVAEENDSTRSTHDEIACSIAHGTSADIACRRKPRACAMRYRMLVVAAFGLLSACATQRLAPTTPASQAPSDFPEAYYRQAAAQGQRILRVDPAESLVVIEVRRGGSLARLGHDHVVASHDVRGFVAPGLGRADLYIRLEGLIVDEPALRADAKFDTQPSDEDIAGTRRNMLKSLDAAQYPFALIHVDGGDGGAGDKALRVAVTVHGITHEMSEPVHIDAAAEAVTVTGSLQMKQTDFGIAPLSVLGGAIQVQDEVGLRFRIRADAPH